MLYRINLLHWRENQREEHRRRFVGLVVLGVMVALGIQWGVANIMSTNKIFNKSDSTI